MFLSNDMQREKTLFYVLVPVYKAERYLRDCIDSVMKQTYQNFELLLVDDGSPDQSGAICDEYASKDSRITVIHKKNQGVFATRQAAQDWARQQSGSLNSKGNSYFVFLDSDDTLKTFALERIQAVIEEKKCDIVIYGMDSVCEGQIVKPYDAENAYRGIVEDKRQLYRIVFMDQRYNALWRKAVSTSLLTGIDYSPHFGIFRGEDLLMSMEYLCGCKRVVFLNESLYNYTVNPTSITHSDSPENCDTSFKVQNRVWKFLKSEDVFTQEDWMGYHAFCTQFVFKLIKRILSFDCPSARKRQLLNDIRSGSYYKEFICRQKYNWRKLNARETLIYGMFYLHLDRLMISACDLYAKLVKR